MAGGHFHNVRAARDSKPSDPNRSAPEAVEKLPPVGNYNAGWVEPGTKYGVVRGEVRSSWIVSPADGRLPLREGVYKRDRSLRETPDDPEVMSLGERCLLGFGGTAGPPMLNVLYNNYYRIVQGRDHVAIVVEMVHDTRLVRLGGEHSSALSPRWLGESVAHWEGDTLVIETANFHPIRALNGPIPYSADAVVTERLTRDSATELHYEFLIEDPTFYTEAIRGEMTFRAVDEAVFEYACHEGNYGLKNILTGARFEEQNEVESASKESDRE